MNKRNKKTDRKVKTMKTQNLINVLTFNFKNSKSISKEEIQNMINNCKNIEMLEAFYLDALETGKNFTVASFKSIIKRINEIN